MAKRRYVFSGYDAVVWGGMGPGAPGFARADSIIDTGKLSLAHATHNTLDTGKLSLAHATHKTLDTGRLSLAHATHKTLDTGKLSLAHATHNTLNTHKGIAAMLIRRREPCPRHWLWHGTDCLIEH